MNVYLIESSSHVLMEEEVDKIIGASKNKIIYNAVDSLIEDILSEASYVSMFEEMKYLVVKNAYYFGSSKVKEEDEKKILAYLAEPYPLCTIIFTTQEPVDSRKKLTKFIKEHHHYTKIEPSKGLELYQKVNNLLINKKYYAEKDSINYLINACLSNYDLIHNEIEKIDLYYGKSTKIKFDDVKSIVSKTLVENQFKFIDAVMERDLKRAKQLLNELIILKVEPLSLINLLAREYRFLLEMKYMESKSFSKKEIKEELHLQDWQIDKIEREARNYHADDIKDYLISLEELDYKIKSGKIDKTVGLDLFLINLYEN